MITEITSDTKGQIKNPAFASYTDIYLEVHRQFMGEIESTGIQIAPEDATEQAAIRREALRKKGARVRNGGRSIVVNRISPACLACQKGIGSVTQFISLRCNRNCYYCFNPNQEDYDYHVQHERDLVSELQQIKASGANVRFLALTGGEPLLFPDQAVAYFEYATAEFSDAHKRLYTCGDFVNEALLQRLQQAGLQEIRFSIRLHDSEIARQNTLKRIALAKRYIPDVLVEMPVPPGTTEIMQDLLLSLERIGIYCINLLEMCYPLANAEFFNERGYLITPRPYRTLYNYWYAGGVPVSGSEQACLDLVEFALEQQLTIGVHYCSLENKLTGQNYQQNHGKDIPAPLMFSQRDYMLKSAKVFGDDIAPVVEVLNQRNYHHYQLDRAYQSLEFGINQIRHLKHLDIEIGISTSTLEKRADGEYVRELKIGLTTPRQFSLSDI